MVRQIKQKGSFHDHDWFLTLVDQVGRHGCVIIGGILKRCITDRERERLTDEVEENLGELSDQVFYWVETGNQTISEAK